MEQFILRFFKASLIYLALGALGGVALAIWPASSKVFFPAITHLSLIGFITQMIIGVTYFIIPVFIKKDIYNKRWALIHFLMVNIGLVGFSLGYAMSWFTVMKVAAVIEALSVYFLTVIFMATVIKGPPVDRSKDPWFAKHCMFLVSESDKEVDKWATNFTRASMTYYLIGCTMGAMLTLDPIRFYFLRLSHAHINLLGWVGMMIVGVAYHFLPRFSGVRLNARLVKFNFQLYQVAFLGLIIMMAMVQYSDHHIFRHLRILFAVLEATSLLIFVATIWKAVKPKFCPVYR
ncbi:MAG: cbb3-type cytochrome c oxidase subunit I [Nitrospirota bacterium]|nr:cbb3-type cytochrome c oxidase subunit I [Nitrospirota bacterium]